jgi:protein-S-isoprenylcysteine O-methyltransferase Ste14
VVRIQTGGLSLLRRPYRWLHRLRRRPGYLATPFFLDAPWALLPAALIIVLLVVRTELEDRTLQQELPGYREYAQKVRYRLLPGVW